MKLTYESPVMEFVDDADIVETNAPILVGILIVIVGVVIPTVAE